ncbi:MAG: hypothetical protein SF052_07955 [Bacteroidia bacterium]|nr:hypothetical protein [Bacteroidia bacterium]
MEQLPQIEKIFIRLEVNQQQLLYIMLSKSGAVNRAGDGSPEDAANMFMGNSDEPLLDDWLELLPEDILTMAGRYTFPDPQGDVCNLTLALEGPEVNTGFEFVYGSQSDGPPEDIIQLVEAAMEITDEWYENQKFSRQQKRKKA